MPKKLLTQILTELHTEAGRIESTLLSSEHFLETVAAMLVKSSPHDTTVVGFLTSLVKNNQDALKNNQQLMDRLARLRDAMATVESQ